MDCYNTKYLSLFNLKIRLALDKRTETTRRSLLFPVIEDVSINGKNKTSWIYGELH